MKPLKLTGCVSEAYPFFVKHKNGYSTYTPRTSSAIFHVSMIFIIGTKIMQVGNGNPIRTYNTEIPSIGSIRGLIDLQRFINHVESLVKQVDIRDPYSSPLAHILG